MEIEGLSDANVRVTKRSWTNNMKFAISPCSPLDHWSFNFTRDVGGPPPYRLPLHSHWPAPFAPHPRLSTPPRPRCLRHSHGWRFRPNRPWLRPQRESRVHQKRPDTAYLRLISTVIKIIIITLLIMTVKL